MMNDDKGNRLVQQLINNNYLQQSDLEKAQGYQQQFGGKIEDILLSQGACSEEDLLSVTANILELPRLADWLESVGMESINSIDNLYGLDSNWWRSQEAFPLSENEGVIGVAIKNIQDDFVPTVLKRNVKKAVQPVIVSGRELRQLLGLLGEGDPSDASGNDPESLRDLATGAPIIHFVNDVIQRAVDLNASDIHFESYRGVFRVRIRVDGVLQEVDRPALSLQSAIISRIKLMANLDISERRLPQDGRIRVRISGRDLDIRVATSPGVAGENIVLRLLDKEEGVSKLDDLNMFADHLDVVKKLLSATNGIILVTGPTGSGKTTSLYTFLEHLMGNERKIITVEDPVEYQTAGITQIQVHSEIGLDFASVLRSVLRQDPDIILIGEIRDRETAEIAVQAALTGHLVLTTLHTNDAPSSFVRLIDMGVEKYLLASSVIGVIAQRLVRCTCPYCGAENNAEDQLAESMGFSEMTNQWPEIVQQPQFVRGQGCDHCFGVGFKGRTAIFELFEANEEIRHVVSTQPEQLPGILRKQGMRKLREDGLLRAGLGQTSVAEVLRVTG